MKNIIAFLIYFILSGLPIFGQVAPKRIELTKDGILFYSTPSKIIKKDGQTEESMTLAKRFTALKYNDYTENRNFVIENNYLVTLNIYKICFGCPTEEDFNRNHWTINYEYIDFSIKTTFKHGFSNRPPALDRLIIPNYYDYVNTTDRLDFDFIHFNSKILLFLTVGDKAFLFESLDRIEKNKWKLLHSYRFQTHLTNFFAYVKDQSIIIKSSDDVRYIISPDRANIKQIYSQATTDVVLYNHITQKYQLLDKKTAGQLILSSDPISFLEQRVKR